MPVKESVPGEQHLAMVSPWPAPKLHLDVITNLHTYLQAANLAVGTAPLNKGVVTLATIALSVVSVQWGQKSLPELVQNMKIFWRGKRYQPKCPSAMAET